MTSTIIGRTTGPWTQTLEQWTRSRYGDAPVAVRGTMPFAPREAPKPRAFQRIPVVMIVLTRRSRHLHAGLCQAVELIREATYGFRAVVFTDDAASPAFGQVDWVVEHCLAEDSLHRLQPGKNWLETVGEHLTWAQREYGASLVLAPEDEESCLDAVRRIAVTFRAPAKIVETAVQRAQELVTRVEGVRQGLRGWWGDLPAGRTAVEFAWGGAQLSCVVHHAQRASAQPSGAVIEVTEGEVSWALTEAQTAEWSTAQIIGPSSGRTSGAGPLAIARAAGEGLADGGPVVQCVADSAALDADWRGIDARLIGASGAGRLVTRVGAVVEFPREQAAEVLRALRRAHL
ncbi:hypothetical protein [Nesterenkonia xinjiangensis]|uniref:Uncharacterized protein n=1 Tax=Nesterenkonia xinjiangensis TaxID=225327 RepID=A0A7Z0K8U1_9MICC|nr:hypothetical protein [Nesterenkonia xinjiangensis]NYJ77013.1 hypothetical protein [Nesterenkonia xinjiangensis]